MVAFYNAGDQAIYNQGYSFIPQERFRLGDPNLGRSTTTAPVTGGINTLPVNMGGGGGGGGFNPYNPDMSQIRTDFDPTAYNLAMRNEEKFGPTVGPNPDMYFTPQSKLQKAIGSAVNFIPGFGALKRGAEFVGGILNQFLPVNQRAILENQLRGQGVLTDDIGRIVAGPGGYNTPEGIMAGYNAAQMTGETFDKRTGNVICKTVMPTLHRCKKREVDTYKVYQWVLSCDPGPEEFTVAIEEPLHHAKSSQAVRSMGISFGKFVRTSRKSTMEC